MDRLNKVVKGQRGEIATRTDLVGSSHSKVVRATKGEGGGEAVLHYRNLS